MKKLLENICSEFADTYNISEADGFFTALVDVEIEDLGDLIEVFQGYNFDLQEIKEVSGDTAKCQAVFIQLEVPASDES